MKAPSYLIDTSVFISLERNKLSPEEVFVPGKTILLTSVVHAELLLGFELDKNRARATKAREFLDELRSVIDYADFGQAEAVCYSELSAFAIKDGSKRSDFDTMIAAMALSKNATIITHDRAAKFAGLPGVKVLEI